MGIMNSMQFFPTRQIFFAAGPIAVHWYGVMYLLAFLFAWFAIPRLARMKGYAFTAEDTGDLLFAGILGTIIGGRFGYVLFYAPEYFGEHPFEILMLWKGGMSSHGGMIGVAIAVILQHRRMNGALSLWQLGDLLAIPIAIGLALGRLGNFINLELYGPITTMPWGIIVPGVEGIRHPTQIYAMAKDLMIAGICTWSFFHVRKHGITLGFFFALYGILRFIIEYIRIETAQGFDLDFIYMTRGQLLTIPVFAIGALILWKKSRNRGNLLVSQ